MSKVAVVCANGVGTSVLISRRLRAIFPEHSFDHFGSAEFKPEKWDIVVTFESMVDRLKEKANPNQKFKTYEGIFDTLGGAGTMESRLSESSTESKKIEELREYLFGSSPNSSGI